MRFIPAVSPVRIQSPLPSTGETPRRLAGPPPPQQKYGPLVKWLRHGPFTAVTWVRFPYGSPCRHPEGRRQFGGLAQLVRAPASHAGGHWFESSSLHQKVPDFTRNQELFLFISSNSDVAFLRFSHDPNRDPKAERSGKHRRGADGIIRPSPHYFFVFTSPD